MMLMFAFGIEHEVALLRPDGHQLEAVKHVIVYRITAPNATRKDYRDEAHQEAESQHIFYFLLDDAIEMRKNEVYYSVDDQRGVRMERNGYAAWITHLSF
jgi:hypothetical protein